MNKKTSLFFWIAFLLMSGFSLAQTKVINGTVTDADKTPLPGANVVVKGSSKGVVTDFDGRFQIEASPGQILEFSFLGFETTQITLGNQTNLEISLKEDVSVLNEVVVTAQGIRREKKSLGYSVTTIEEEKIQQKAEPDIGRVLQGKAAGVNVTSTNGLTGSGTNIIIRGYSSVSESNQPLFVVDGVPFNSDTNTQSNFLDNGTESSRFLDLDPNTIESVNVLKGLSATTLYGQAGSNGVILITTKNGVSGTSRKKFEVSLTQSVFASEAILPDYQNEYGGGFHQSYGFFFSNWGPAFNGDLSANPNFIGIAPNGTTLVNGPLGNISDQTLLTGLEDQINIPYEYRPYDSVKDFFKTGYQTTTSINMSGGSEKASFNMSYTHVDDAGVTPGNGLRRNNFGFGGRAKLSNKFTVSGVLNYAVTDFKSPPVAPSFGSGTGFDGGSVFGDLLYTPRSVNLFGLPFQSQDGRSVYYRAGNDIQNPRWTVANASATQDVRRVFGNASIKYDFTDWLNASYRVGIDQYTESNTYGQNRGGVDGQIRGIYRTSSVINTIWDHTLLLNSNFDFTEDLSFNATLGFNPRWQNFEREGVESVGQITFGVLEHFNFTSQSSFNSFTNLPIGDKETEVTIGGFFDSTLNYKDYLYLNLSARNDWTSTLETGNNSLLYPGVSLSFIPTEAFELSGDALNYMKVRFGYGSSAGFPSPYQTRNNALLTPRALVNSQGAVTPSITIGDQLGNPNLKPERIQEFELGIDSKFFNRLNFNVSVFSKTTTDLITDQALDFSTGFGSFLTNIGELNTKGIEVDYSLDVIKSENLKWNIAGNFYADENEVVDIDDNVEQILLTQGVIGEAANYAVEGRPYGVLLGSTWLRDEETGERIVNNNGLYVIDETLREIGDPNPDWITNLNTTLTYKGFSVYMDWQFRHGGDIYSTTASTLLGRGVIETDNPIDREALYVLPGRVRQFDASGAPNGTIPNTTQITATNLGFNIYGVGAANETAIYDGTTLRLNEVSLSYAMPKKFIDNTPFGSITLKASGFNMWFKAFNFPEAVNFDTNSLSTGVGNGLGIDFITGPSVRRYGLSLKATF